MHMSFGESLLISLFCILIVFVVLTSIFVLIQLFSKILAGFDRKQSATLAQPEAQPVAPASVTFAPGPDLSAGELRLKNVDEKIAAMIMAIVSDESSIPLSELRFKSIKLIEEES